MKKALILIFLTSFFSGISQTLTPGFNKDEYRELMLISAQTTNNPEYIQNFVRPENYSPLYRSAPMAMDNLWDMWVHNQEKKAVISLRGTTEKAESWLLNFYAAMVPATGQLRWGDDHTFDYQLSEDPRAAVHVGWLIGMAFLSEDILQKIDYLYKDGIRDILIIGHSQGGGIAYLLSSHFAHLKSAGKLPNDLQFKTYCSAAPKPGNLYYAYSFESQFQNGWAFNVVNAADWVPEVPISIQTLDDFNETNPFIHAEDIIEKQRLTRRIVLKHVYKRLDKPTRKAQKNYQKYLGDEAQKLVQENIPDLEVPKYITTNNYVRTGTQIVLQPDEAYYSAFPNDSSKVFTHHTHQPYLYLTEKLGTPFYEEEQNPLHKITWNLIWFDHEASEKWDYSTYQPTLTLALDAGIITGSTGCNRFSGPVEYNEGKIQFDKELMMTKKACPKIEEQAFLETLKKAEEYIISADFNRLMLISRDQIIMEFSPAE